MKNPRLLLALALPAALAFVRPADEIAYSPREGLRLTKTFEREQDVAMDDVEMRMNGEESPMPSMEQETLHATSTTVTDHYVEIEDGRPIRVERTFDGLSGEMEVSMVMPGMSEQESESSSTSDLEGLTVVFTWNEEEGEYDVAFSEEDAGEDEELLEGLEFDMDMEAFLPGRGVSEGDTWEVDPERVLSLLAPGGNLKVAPEELPGGMDMPTGDMAEYIGVVDGSITATYEGTRDEGGRRVGVIAIVVDIEAANDITDLVRDAVEASGQQSEMGMEQDVQAADVEMLVEMEGELLWDMEGGHFLSYELSGDSETILDIVAAVAMRGEEMEVEQTIYLSGPLTISAEVTTE